MEYSAAKFDFDEWAKLARDDPDEFERRRRATIDAFIASAPAQRRRLEGTQWRLDRERELAHTPLKACLRISALMWESLLEMKSGLEGVAAAMGSIEGSIESSRTLALVAQPREANHVDSEAQAPRKTSAKILPFSLRTDVRSD
jgi:uncharacterized protein DUF3135